MAYIPGAFLSGMQSPNRAAVRSGEYQRQGIVQSQFDASNALADDMQNNPLKTLEQWREEQSIPSTTVTPEGISTAPPGPSTYTEYRQQHKAARYANALRAGGFEALQAMQQRGDYEDWMHDFGYARTALQAFERGDVGAQVQALNNMSEALGDNDRFTVGADKDGTPVVLDSAGNPVTYQDVVSFTEQNMVRPENYLEFRRQDQQASQFDVEQERLNKVLETNIEQFNAELEALGEYRGAMIDIERAKLQLTEAGLWMDFQAALAQGTERDVKEMFEIHKLAVEAGLVPHGEDSPAPILLIGEAAALAASAGIDFDEAYISVLAATGADTAALEEYATSKAVRNELEATQNAEKSKRGVVDPKALPKPKAKEPERSKIGAYGLPAPAVTPPKVYANEGEALAAHAGKAADVITEAVTPSEEAIRKARERRRRRQSTVGGSALPVR